MDYTTRLADDPKQSHVNYQCPCGCVAGLMYDRESGSEHLGACCCGRLLWLGGDAEAVVRSHFESGIGYELETNSVTLPWGEVATAVLAVPTHSLKVAGPGDATHDHDHKHEGHAHAHDHDHDDQHGHEAHEHDAHMHEHDDDGHVHLDRAAVRVRDVVCGMMIDPETAAGSSLYQGETYYFCALGCKQKFEAEPTRYVKSKGLLSRIFGRS